MIIPDKGTRTIKNISLSPRIITMLKLSGILIGFCLLVSLFAIYQGLEYKNGYDRVNNENKDLRENVVAIQYQLKSIERSFNRINEFSKKVKMLTDLDNDSKQLMAIGPLTEEDELAMSLQKKKF